MTPREELTACPLHANTPPDDGLEALIEDCPACLAALDQALANQVRELRAACPLLPRRAAVQPECPAPTPPRVADYEILGEIGRGGLGVVYRAQQSKLGRPVAVKVMLGGGHAGERERERLRREARILAKLSHPNLVAVHDAGVGEDGLPYLVMELVDGATLSQRLANGALPAREAAALLRTLAVAVQYAHEQGVIHRDLKPANVLLCRRASCQLALEQEQAGSLLYDGAKIADFGLARLLDDDTQSSAVMGTPNYIAPEQVAGIAASPTMDVYGLGAILYECLTARPPYQGANKADTLAQVLGDEPLPPLRLRPELPPDLETICLKCLRKEPWRRYATAQALADDLCRFLAGEPIAARPPGLASHVWRGCRRYPVASGLTAALALVVTIALCAFLLLWRVAEGRRQAEESAKIRANANSDDVRQTLAEFVRLGEQGTFRVDSSRLSLSRRMVRHYRDLLEERPDDDALLVEAARIVTRVAELEANAYRWEAALPTFREARSLWEKVSRRSSSHRVYQTERAVCLTRLSWVAGQAGEDEGEGVLREAAALWAAIGGAGLPYSQKVRILQTHHALADTLACQGRLAEARSEFRRARDWIADFRREANDAGVFLTEEILTWHHEASTLQQQGDEGEAVRCWRKAFELGSAAHPPNPHHGEICLKLMGRPDMEPYYSLGVALIEQEFQAAERRVDANPDDLRGARWALLHADRLITAHLGASRPDLARSVLVRLDKKLDLLALRLSRDDTESIQFLKPAVRVAELWVDCQDQVKALAWCQRVRDLLPRWAETMKEPRQRSRVADLAHRVAILLRKCGSPGEALLVLNQFTPFAEFAARQQPDSMTNTVALFQMWEQAGKCHVALGRSDLAEEAWKRGIEVLRVACTRRPDNSVLRERLARRCAALGRHLIGEGRPADAQPWLDEARRLLPTDRDTQRLLAEAARKID